jgi:hypothetical protein
MINMAGSPVERKIRKAKLSTKNKVKSPRKNRITKNRIMRGTPMVHWANPTALRPNDRRLDAQRSEGSKAAAPHGKWLARAGSDFEKHNHFAVTAGWEDHLARCVASGCFVAKVMAPKTPKPGNKGARVR